LNTNLEQEILEKLKLSQELPIDKGLKIKKLIIEFKEIFKPKIEKTNVIKHQIKLNKNVEPISQMPYTIKDPEKKKFLKKEISRMLKEGIIRKSMSPWSSPVVLVEKKDGTLRFCVDYRKVNKITKRDSHPLPRIDDLLETFRGANYFTTADLMSGFWQVEMIEEHKEITAFITNSGLFEFNIMPFGLKNAPALFQRLMNYVLQDYLDDFVAVYIDDIIIYSKTFEEHLEHLRKVFTKLKEANLMIKLSKCRFCEPEIIFLGHKVGKYGLRPDPEKVQKIKDFPTPTNVKTLQSALGLFSYYRRFVKDFSKIAKPMTSLLRKDVPFIWTQKQQKSFEILKSKLMEAPILQYPNFEKPFIIMTDASTTGLGAVLSQLDDNKKERVIAYASKSLNRTEQNYPTTELEGYGVIWAIRYFHKYLLTKPFKIFTDHSALKYLQTMKNPKAKIARWIMELQQYDFEIEHRPGKSNKNADALSRIPINTTQKPSRQKHVRFKLEDGRIKKPKRFM